MKRYIKGLPAREFLYHLYRLYHLYHLHQMMIFNNQDRECFVTLSGAKGLSRWAQRCFAALSMTELDLSVDEELSSSFEPCLKLIIILKI
jgi:hypothetical protein